jgi:hypothetical protein
LAKDPACWPLLSAPEEAIWADKAPQKPPHVALRSAARRNKTPPNWGVLSVGPLGSDLMHTSIAIGAWEPLPVGYAMLVIVLLSLLLWAILLILLWQLFDTESAADFQENI